MINAVLGGGTAILLTGVMWGLAWWMWRREQRRRRDLFRWWPDDE